MIRRFLAVATALIGFALVALAACNDGKDTATPTTATSPVTTAPPASTTTTAIVVTTVGSPPTTTAGATTTVPSPTAATAVIEPDTVAGIPLGSNKSQAIAVLGTPTVTGQLQDLSGATYDFLRWDIGGNRSLTLNYRTPSATSPLLTDWQVTGRGPATRLGIRVGDTTNQVTAAYGPLQDFCCDTKVANVERGGGRLIVIVDNASQVVRQLVGGDPAFWSRSIAS